MESLTNASMEKRTGTAQTWKRLLSFLSSNHEILGGTILLTLIIIVGIVGLAIISPSTPGIVSLSRRLLPLSNNHLFGTDIYGRDVLQMVVLAIPYDISIALLVILISSTGGLLLGTFAAYRGGILDEAIMRITDIFLSFPALILALAVGSVIGRSYFGLILTLLSVQWTGYVRLARGQVISEKQRPYVAALRKLGVSSRRIIFRHLIRNTMFPIVVTATLDLANVILVIAGLSFLGLGGGPLSPDWGTLIAQGIGYFLTSPWPVVFPGIAILFTALAFNMLGDGLRDAVDPRMVMSK